MKKLTSFVLIVSLMVICLGSTTASANTIPCDCKCFFETVTSVHPDVASCTRHSAKYVFNAHAVRKACDGQSVEAIVESFVFVCNALLVEYVPDSDGYTHIEMTFKNRTMGVLYDKDRIIVIERN